MNYKYASLDCATAVLKFCSTNMMLKNGKNLL